MHDLVDNVSEEARRAGAFAADWLAGRRPARQLRVRPGSNVRYVTPARADPSRANRLYLRPLIVKNRALLSVSAAGRRIRAEVKNHVQPSEMISFTLRESDFAGLGDDSALEIAIT